MGNSMDLLERDVKEKILSPAAKPCLSLYQPTHRKHPENEQDPIRFKNLVRELGDSLSKSLEDEEVDTLLKPFRELEGDNDFWQHVLDGLVVLSCNGFFRTYRLQRPVPEIAVIADSFHIKPLMRIIQSSDRFQVLGLDRKKMRLFEGNRDAIAEVDLADSVPATLEEALGSDLTEQHSTVAAYGGTSARVPNPKPAGSGRDAGGAGTPGAGTQAPAAMHHGHGGRSDEIDKDTRRFFQAVDRAVWDHYSAPSGLPLILASLPEYHGEFAKISNNKHLLERKIGKHPDSLDPDALRELAWEAFKPEYSSRLEKLTEELGTAKAHGNGSAEPAEIGRAIAEGRVRTLLVDADRQVPGKYDPEFGTIQEDDLAEPGTDDLLDDLAEAAFRKGADLVVVPSGDMPVDSGIAAIYRF
ncbi:MAG: hypothetical protein J5I65_11350 [Aridibacter famidurans]|nr:hypothetical protein [Aridibacter famidurans]